ncbi:MULTISPECIES: prepilin peptidase [unclassified Sphingobium]|uniref:prepilin peptidase n=1 Tax=unclassified Sphingobium TaxID=2611147 RepID=UPI002224DA23|nr:MULTISPECIES: A24 family peptidase [unclassified Sphingobium]MCW2382399.1 leader peptidase (prepilin peptidase)/N-methyltransferase [Sphingobium sp. B2D3B]MCW2397428.1 leader peptidase (prepilin peptidase)/N-methyltransferase [Sphingobium sp. B2D3C]
MLGADLLRMALGCGLGLIAGSFLGAIVTRWPRGESVMRGRSACDACGRTLGAIDLIPLLSALRTRGRCRTCGARIDPAHVIMELGAAMIGGVCAWLLPLPAAALVAVALWILLALAVLDARHFWLPDALTLPLAVLGLTLGDWLVPAPFADRMIGAAIGYIGLFLLAMSYRRLRGREGLGLGDAKLLGAIGAWLGWQLLPVVLLLASVGGLIWAVILRLKGHALSGNMRLPFGTFLCLAAPLAARLAWTIAP